MITLGKSKVNCSWHVSTFILQLSLFGCPLWITLKSFFRYSVAASMLTVHAPWIFGRAFVKTVALCYRTVVLSVCRSVCDVGVLWPNGWMDQDETWRGGRPRPRPHYVRWRPSFPPQKTKDTAPQFSAHVCCGQTAGRIKTPLGTTVGLGPGHIVLDGDPSPPKRGTAPSTPIFGPCLLWPNGRPSWLLLNTCYREFCGSGISCSSR